MTALHREETTSRKLKASVMASYWTNHAGTTAAGNYDGKWMRGVNERMA